MIVVQEQFTRTSSYKKISMACILIGILSLLIGAFVYLPSNDEHTNVIFWGGLLHNSVFALLVANSAMFFICATTLAMGGWQTAFRRIPEAISALVPILGIITFVILIAIVFSHQHHIYHWLDTEAVKKDEILHGKSGFLNAGFYIIWSFVAIGAWAFVGKKMRQLSYELDAKPLENVDAKKRYVFKNTVWAALFLVVFALTVGSTIPWLWLMSIDAHWYSTMYSWYTLISAFVTALALIMLYVISLKSKQHLLQLTTSEHIHDLGKFMFAFSIFWAYLWFSQFMLIWYANIPEETLYFKSRHAGLYKGIFYTTFTINFFVPFLVLMTRDAKRNAKIVSFMAILLIIGHWLDFYQMVFPKISTHHIVFCYDAGIFVGFVGLFMFLIGKKLEKHNLVPANHPFIKESMIYTT